MNKHEYEFDIDARFALGPSILHLANCGPDSAAGSLWKYIQSGESSGIPELLKKFPNLDAFQSTLGEVTHKDPFAPEIQEAYWLGNSLLEKALDPNNYGLLILHYKRHHAFEGYINELKQKTPKQLILNHNFQVSFIGIIDAGGNLDNSLGPVNQCMVRGGQISEITANHALVKSFTLMKKSGRYVIEPVVEEVAYDVTLVNGLKPKDYVATHWGSVAAIISSGQHKSLYAWSEKVAAIL